MIPLPSATKSSQLASILTRARQYKILGSALHCLAVIDAGGADSLTMTTIAQTMGISTAALTEIADQLEARGFIARRTARCDRRLIWLDITQRGKDALTDILTSA